MVYVLPRVKNFLGKYELRTGAIVVARTEILCCILGLIYELGWILTGNYYEDRLAVFFDIINNWVLVIVHLVFTILMLNGVYNNDEDHVRRWLICASVLLMVRLTFIQMGFMVIIFDEADPELVYLVISGFIMYGIHTYFIVVVRSYLDEMIYGKEENPTSVPQTVIIHVTGLKHLCDNKEDSKNIHNTYNK